MPDDERCGLGLNYDHDGEFWFVVYVCMVSASWFLSAGFSDAWFYSRWRNCVALMCIFDFAVSICVGHVSDVDVCMKAFIYFSVVHFVHSR